AVASPKVSGGDFQAFTDQLKKVSDVQKALDDGKDFAEIAKQYSEDTATSDKGGDLGWFARGMITKLDIEKDVFALDAGKVSAQKSDQSQTVWYKVLEKDPSRALDDDQKKKISDHAYDYWFQGQKKAHQILRPHLLEEAYEALEALDSGDLPRLRDELGDLLLQIALHAQLAHEEGAFDIADVAARLNEKLIRRHPHVFAGAEISGDLLAQWDRIKREELEEGGKPLETITAGVPKDLPALFAAERLLERAQRVGLKPERI